MNNTITKYGIIIFAWVAVLYPLWVRFSAVSWTWWSTEQITFNLFPFFGILAFTLLWLHSLSGVFEPWLRRHINFDRFVTITASIILLCLIAHPLLLLISFDFDINNILMSYGITYILVGIVGWLLLITYDITKPFKKQGFFAKHWNKVLIVSNIGFLITFFHSLALGSDLQMGPLRAIWMLYGITAILAITYTYGIKRFIK